MYNIGVLTQHCFQVKMDSFLCILAVHLHDIGILGGWKPISKMGFKVQVF